MLGVAGLTATGCRHTPPRVDAVDGEAREYVRLVLALGERDPDSLDFAVVPKSQRARAQAEYMPLDEIARQAAALRGRVEPAAGGSARATFLLHQILAVEARAAMLRGRILPFDDEARALFDIGVLPDDAASERMHIRAQLQTMLPAAGGSLAERYGAYSGRFLVPQARLRDVMQAALGACRRQTLQYIALPPGESVTLQFVGNKPWAAFSLYEGHAHSVISLNLDFPVTVDEALELACHEGYPGHHVFNSLRDAAMAGGNHWPEAQVQPTFSPQSYLSEAVAAYAPLLAFSPAERAAVERDVLFPAAGLAPAEAEQYVAINLLARQLDTAEPAIAREYLDGSLEFARAEQRLEREALLAHSESVLLYLNEYRSYMLAYTDGPRRVARVVGEGDRTQQWERYRRLMTELVPVWPQ